jgi:tryptophan-rich sensory protein
MNKKEIIKLSLSVLIPLLIGFIGSYFTAPAIPEWYAGLNKPSLNPPNWIFAPVWTILYIFMGVAFFLVWKETTETRRKIIAFAFFGAQLVLNLTWSIFFFGMKNPELALMNIILLVIALIATMISFYKISKKTLYLLIPYLLWISFASYLNYQIIVLN